MTLVHAGVGARHVGQDDIEGLAQQRHLSVDAGVKSGGAVRKISDQQAAEMRRLRLLNLLRADISLISL